MNEITLATLIEEKFRGEALSGNDKRKYIGNDWLIDEIVRLLKKHPELKELINIDEMSISQISNIFEQYFQKINSRRKLNKRVIINFVKQHSEFRKMESLVLLLV
jgi:tRNA-dihydrouridine synthase